MMNRVIACCLVGLVACGGSRKPDVDIRPDRPIEPGVPVAQPPAPPANPDEVPFPLWSDVKRGTLPNGLTYYVMKNKKPEKRVLLWLAVNSGAVQEDDDQRGLAHFVEHMAFNGTKRFPKHDIIKYVEQIGMRFGPDLNAYTSFEETVYQLEVPTDDKALVSKGFDVLRDWSADITLDPKEVDAERGVVLEEWRLGLGASRRLFDKHIKVLYKGTRYAERLPIGQPEILKNAPQSALARYYKDWYRPDQMAVIAVGDFEDGAAIEKEIVAKFGDLKKADNPRPRPSGGVPKADGTRISIETDKEQTTTSVAVYNMLAHRPEHRPVDFRRSILEDVYEQIFNERFRVLARKKDAPFMGAFASMSNNVRDIDAFSRGATARNGRVEDALRAIFAEVLRIEQHGFTQGELDRARVIIARQREQAVADAPTARSRSHAQEIVRNFLENEFMIGRTAERDFTLKVLPELTLAELNQLARSYGGPENRVVVISGPDGAPLPTQDRVLAIVGEVEKSKLDAWVDQPTPTTLITTAPKPGKITKEAKIDAIGVTEWTLSNGARVLVKPTDFEADSVLLRGSSPGGLAMASAAQYPHARFADAIVSVGGAGEHDAEQLRRVLAGKQASASTSIGAVTESLAGSASTKDLETMFQLAYLRATAPRQDDEAIAVWRANQIENLKNRERSPEAQYFEKSDLVLYKNHPRRRPTKPGDVEKADVAKALAFYKSRFADFSDFTFVIVGNVELDKLRPLVETYLASLPGKNRKEKEKDVGIRRLGGKVEKSWALGEAPRARVSIRFHGDEAWTRDKERDMFVLSRVVSTRLREVMREDLGGVYGVGAGGFLSRSPRQERTFTISFAADPSRVEELVKAARAEVDKIAKDGVEPRYLENVKTNFLRSRELELRNNSFWAGWLESSARYGDDPKLVLDTAPVVARMTVEHVKAAAKRFIDGKQYYRSVMMPAPLPSPDGKPAAKPQ